MNINIFNKSPVMSGTTNYEVCYSCLELFFKMFTTYNHNISYNVRFQYCDFSLLCFNMILKLIKK